MENSEETLCTSAEWDIRHQRGDANIDANVSRGFVAEMPRRSAARGE
jgi:hypothetical protein